jgi:DNA-binding GntR family transcriptional regulator
MVTIRRTTYKDQVIERIYDLVLDGYYLPGEQVKETQVAEEMGISRAPVREALRELIAVGIVEYRPQVGNFIALLSPKQIVDAYTTRGVLEGFAIMQTMESFDEDDLDQLNGLVESMERAALKGNRKKVVTIGGEFHDLLMHNNKNVQLAEYTERLSLKLHILFYRHWSTLYEPEEIGNRHRRIVRSLASRDAQRIEVTVREHYNETGSKIAALQE